ncbi:hypothetical protein [Mucilaginibacter paludis]|uniref:Lipoprotein n=1 Tax=Mucilaginibacter paludis DSM 18603 TaxID=714943 RepID=H1Y9Z3_9SPHI|nr:hypothetical protein [Mucilaginibacter paludis]EHQ24977.1 hypothetical protein Mucpa_0796 [Mucilaginibacter paludis DSM 18603]
MATAKSINKWLIGIPGLAIIIMALSACNQRNKQKRDDQLSYNCNNKVWYDVPDIQFKGYLPAVKPIVVIKRGGQILENKLQLKEISRSDTINYQLAAITTDTALINRSDTVLISVGNEKYAIYGFKSNSYYGDHHIVDCDNQYQLNGKIFKSKELNFIYSRKQSQISLHPLSPFTYEFKDNAPQGKYVMDRADFFYADANKYLTKEQQKQLFAIVKAQKDKINGNYNALSIYVYKKTDKLNPTYKGSFQDIKGVYDNDLLSYTRWMNGRMDIFYMIKDGNVVYDMAENKEMSPPFEFN